MQQSKPKYSIIIPARNGGKYLPTCVNTIISQDYRNYELIISDDHSTDGSKEYLATLSSHPNVIVIEPHEPLSMTEHWEWALSHAQGEWLIFVGQDDGLQPYFFALADKLTLIAYKTNLRAIMSERAYFFWKGCDFIFGDKAVGYHARNAIKKLNFRYEVIKALLISQSYFDLPQMYTTSLFHRDLIAEAKQKQKGQLFITHPQDANLAAIACSLDKQYLMSYIPLGWVGTSPKSAGMAVSKGERDAKEAEINKDLGLLKQEYIEKINNSELEYNYLAGDFSFGSGSIYFWQALLQTHNLRQFNEYKFIDSSLFKIILFSRVFNQLILSRNKSKQISMFKEILLRNNCYSVVVYLLSTITILALPIYILGPLHKKTARILDGSISYVVKWIDNPTISMMEASSHVKDIMEYKKWLDNQ